MRYYKVVILKAIGENEYVRTFTCDQSSTADLRGWFTTRFESIFDGIVPNLITDAIAKLDFSRGHLALLAKAERVCQLLNRLLEQENDEHVPFHVEITLV